MSDIFKFEVEFKPEPLFVLLYGKYRLGTKWTTDGVRRVSAEESKEEGNSDA